MKHVTFKTENRKVKTFAIDNEIYTEIYDKQGNRVFDKIYKRGDSFNLCVIASIESYLETNREEMKSKLIERHGWVRLTAKREREISNRVNNIGVFRELKDLKNQLTEISEK